MGSGPQKERERESWRGKGREGGGAFVCETEFVGWKYNISRDEHVIIFTCVCIVVYEHSDEKNPNFSNFFLLGEQPFPCHR